MTNFHERHDQIYPTFTPLQVEAALRFSSSPPRRFVAGEKIYDVSDRLVPAWLVLEGSIDATRHDGVGNHAAIITYLPGQLTGETNQLSGRATLVAAVAGAEGVVAAPFDAAHLRALIIGSAEIGEAVMRSFILRRVALIEAGLSGGAGSVLVGRKDDPEIQALTGFLTRNGYPHTLIPACEAEGQALVERFGMHPTDLPLMICPNGTVLKRPTTAEVASCLGVLPDLDPQKVYDVAIIGAGPSGLATAVYAASEGLSVLVLDAQAYGGQAGASARIENYLGFPTGISGQALAGRAFTQAMKFGADLAIPLSVRHLQCPPGTSDEPFRLDLDSGTTAMARTVVIASGVRYRRPDIPEVGALEGAGVSYWASPIEARLCAGEEIALVGGGNSAGQAVAFLAPQVKTLHLLARRPLEETMSRYLIDRIAALSNVELHVPSEIIGLMGDRASGLTGARFRNRQTGVTKECHMKHLFLFIGADPNTGWLRDCIDLDDKGFVLTGATVSAAAASPHAASRRGVFAVGDVRAGSTKRVAAAVGEGAAVVAQIHAFLARQNS